MWMTTDRQRIRTVVKADLLSRPHTWSINKITRGDCAASVDIIIPSSVLTKKQFWRTKIGITFPVEKY